MLLVVISVDTAHRVLRRVLLESSAHRSSAGIVAVVSPIQDGASKVLSPVRDVAGLGLDHAACEVRRTRSCARSTRVSPRRTPIYKYELIEFPQLRREIKLDQAIGVASYSPVGADR